MSGQLGASGNLNLWSLGPCSTNLYDTLSREIKRTACIAATRGQSVLIQTYYTPYITIISIINTIIRIISKLKIQILVHIHCRKLANRHIHNWGSVSKQTTSSKDSVCKNQRFLTNGVSSISCSIPIYLTDACHPASAHSRLNLKLNTQCINGLGNGSAFVQPDVICDTEFNTHLKIIDMM